MPPVKIPRRISTALINSLSAGVTPRIGLEYIAVGRKREIETLLSDLSNIGEGGSVFRFIVGRYGSGKSFLLQIIRNYAMERGYVVTDADLSPERKLIGGSNNGLATYRELLRNMSSNVRPDGGALPALLEKWINGIIIEVMQETGLSADDPGLAPKVELNIQKTITKTDTLVHGFDFSRILLAYWRGWNEGNDDLKSSAMRWLRGEYNTKSDAYSELGVRNIITDDTWFDYLKLLSVFISMLGYKGFIVLLDEGVNLYKISNTISRNNNYEKLLNMFNDTMQGKVSGMGIYMCGTPQFVEDMRRGLFSYEALRTRLSSSRFMKDGMKDMQGSLMYLDKLTTEELFVLLKKVSDLHKQQFDYKFIISDDELLSFMQIVANRLGADELLTPREVIRDFIGILNYIHQNPGSSFLNLIGAEELFKKQLTGSENEEEGATEFTL
ncbi:MAG: ATP-binding protein [Eubacteriales bacterium]